MNNYSYLDIKYQQILEKEKDNIHILVSLI